MTQEEKINYMRIAASVCGFGFKNEQLDLMVSLYELILEKKGESDIASISKIEEDVKEREKINRKLDLLDKISDKV